MAMPQSSMRSSRSLSRDKYPTGKCLPRKLSSHPRTTGSSYLTCIAAGQTSPIVYAVDEIEPVFPDVKSPDGAAFGVIGLDRNVVWFEEIIENISQYTQAGQRHGKECLSCFTIPAVDSPPREEACAGSSWAQYSDHCISSAVEARLVPGTGRRLF
jgi:hypothetical protein